jgi:hypothetical protein
MKSIDNLIESEEKHREKFRNGTFGKIWKEFFKLHPNIKGIKWEQYTPYFNDGEECTFRVGYFEVSASEQFVESEVNDTFTPEDIKDTEGWDCVSSLDGKLYKTIEELKAIPDELFRTAFGDHAQIIVTPKKIVVKKYDHE